MRSSQPHVSQACRLLVGVALAAPWAPACGGTDEQSPANGGATASGGSWAVPGGAAPLGGKAATAGKSAGGSSSGGGPAVGGQEASGGTAGSNAPGSAGAPAAGSPSASAGMSAEGGRGGAGGMASGAGRGGTSAAGAMSSSGGAGGSSASAGSSGSTATGGSANAGKGAPESKAVGYGRNATGAGSASPVSVSSFAAAQAAIDAYSGSGGLALRYTGQVDFDAISDPCTQHERPEQILQIKNKSDITILGADGSAADFGIHVAAASSNIVIRNMTFGLLTGGDASDAISVEGMSGGVPKDIWIDHNEFFSSMVECEGAGDTAFDGLIDLKKGADAVTVSYNFIHDHHKASLNGFSDSDTAVRHITFYRNVFQNVGSRTPLQRGGYSHVVNNLFSGVTTSGINVRMGGFSLVEANFFENAKNPVTSRDSDALGDWELRANNVTGPADFTKFGITWSASDSSPTKDATDWTTTKPYPMALGYTYTALSAGCVKAGLAAVAGAGKGLATLTCQ